jgi:hypothetical protein
MSLNNTGQCSKQQRAAAVPAAKPRLLVIPALISRNDLLASYCGHTRSAYMTAAAVLLLLLLTAHHSSTAR